MEKHGANKTKRGTLSTPRSAVLASLWRYTRQEPALEATLLAKLIIDFKLRKSPHPNGPGIGFLCLNASRERSALHSHRNYGCSAGCGR